MFFVVEVSHYSSNSGSATDVQVASHLLLLLIKYLAGVGECGHVPIFFLSAFS